ncbi:hypothetical protein EVAR_60967_1 [Eumeta japonica]|uniref:Uncharacterized protein n=1 Tax=Eumeta variegata TaxID=151549 RepID=A0A4C1XUW7_EUMVA|nr:hypothetical protein EVAR_60967_1 [Eumeta japonica]
MLGGRSAINFTRRLKTIRERSNEAAPPLNNGHNKLLTSLITSFCPKTIENFDNMGNPQDVNALHLTLNDRLRFRVLSRSSYVLYEIEIRAVTDVHVTASRRGVNTQQTRARATANTYAHKQTRSIGLMKSQLHQRRANDRRVMNHQLTAAQTGPRRPPIKFGD